MRLHSLENDPEYINLQIEMVRMQNWIIENKKRLLIIFEGRVVALGKPTDIEKGQWYFQRYISHLPKPGEMVFFDRSWYNRAVVEPVMGFCNKDQYQLFMKQVVQMEDMLIDDGCQIIKFWFSIDKDEQHNRLEERKANPYDKKGMTSERLEPDSEIYRIEN